ncbi:hypothetical protein WA026_003548 [Henosepilachna vigintioctopunctata]|uniref:Regucalcin n=1 Tax=Henosepilachna vigintioctopunctata TaxID=420089 RepID=A0AAW1TRN6_9CUCU
MVPSIERIVEDIKFGEGPHWDIQSQSLYFVDYLNKSINRYVPATKSHFKANLGEKYSSFVIPIEGQQQKFVIGVEKEIATVKWNGVENNIEELHKLIKLDDLDNKNILNDGKCDVAGRLWTGTLRGDVINIIAHTTDESEKTLSANNGGSFYSYSNSLKKHLDGVDISNGIAWNKSNTKMFYNDTLKKRVDQFDFDVETGEISNREVLFSFERNEVGGLPDGMTIDDEDNLWIAVYRGSKIIKISSKIPDTLLEIINMPAKQVTSMAWGGEKLDELYVTTANFSEIPVGIHTSEPVDGSLYRITGLNAKGLPMNKFKL